MTPEEFAEQTLTRREILVCVGCGGVGKTTVAAALALEAARRGRRVLVLTIDPARRLADALGVEISVTAPNHSRDELDALGVPEHGSLSAVMLDMKRTFDEMVERFTETAEARERVFENPIYQHATETLAGSIEYSAMEKVFELYESGDFDLILVDTPPSQHALDFLDAPQRLIEFLDSRLVQMLIHPAFVAGRLGFRLFHRGTQRVLRMLERLSGIGFLEDISEFLLAFEGMADGFRERARRVRALLLGPSSAFLLVAAPGSESVRQSTQFLDRLESYGVPLAAILVNRIRLWPSGELSAESGPPSEADLQTLAAALRASEGESYPSQIAAEAAVNAATGYAERVRSDARSTQPLRARTEGQGRFWGCVPEFEEDVHDLRGLARVADEIVGRNRESGGNHGR